MSKLSYPVHKVKVETTRSKFDFSTLKYSGKLSAN